MLENKWVFCGVERTSNKKVSNWNPLFASVLSQSIPFSVVVVVLLRKLYKPSIHCGDFRCIDEDVLLFCRAAAADDNRPFSVPTEYKFRPE